MLHKIFLFGFSKKSALIVSKTKFINSSSLTYLLGVSIVGLVDIALLAYGRASAATETYYSEVKPAEIEWPRLENF